MAFAMPHCSASKLTNCQRASQGSCFFKLKDSAFGPCIRKYGFLSVIHLSKPRPVSKEFCGFKQGGSPDLESKPKTESRHQYPFARQFRVNRQRVQVVILIGQVQEANGKFR